MIRLDHRETTALDPDFRQTGQSRNLDDFAALDDIRRIDDAGVDAVIAEDIIGLHAPRSDHVVALAAVDLVGVGATTDVVCATPPSMPSAPWPPVILSFPPPPQT